LKIENKQEFPCIKLAFESFHVILVIII